MSIKNRYILFMKIIYVNHKLLTIQVIKKATLFRMAFYVFSLFHQDIFLRLQVLLPDRIYQLPVKVHR